MRAPLSWLRDYAPLAAEVSVLAETLSSLGLVVEGIEVVGRGLGDVVVGKVLSIRAHPDADRIRLVDVDAGDGEALQIVCGAWNFVEGDLVPLAPVGATLPGGFAIARRKMRGEWSNGMLCSAAELELPTPAGAADGLLVLSAGLADPGVPLIEALDLSPDTVFDLDVSANRPDALCMAGVARDLAAALGETWARPENSDVLIPDAEVGTASVAVDAGDLCPRFTGTVLEGIPNGPSPVWMARRLTLAGMRPINAVVDVSNYVMLDVGQPNHPYDLDRLGGGGLTVRRGQPGEVLVTLDGTPRALRPDDCVIADAHGVGVGVGGIMGGSDAEISTATRRVLLEAAWFSPMAIARTGARLTLHSEARVRFERGVDPEIAPIAVERFISLLSAVAASGGGSLRRGPTVDVQDKASLPTAPIVTVRTQRVNAILGTFLEDAEIAGLLTPIGFAVSDAAEAGEQSVQVPSWRLDTEREIDVIEEVARMWGYRRIERTLPAGHRGAPGGLTARQRDRRRVREILAGAGYDEAWTTTFLAPGDLERAGLDPVAVEVENPLDRSESILRTALLPGLLKAVKFNLDRQAGDVCLFEIGHVFAMPTKTDTPEETEDLAVIVAPADSADGETALAAATRTWSYLADALRIGGHRLEAVVLPGWHPTRVARIAGPSGALLGGVGEVDPKVVAAYGIDRRVGYLTLSLDGLLDETRLPLSARPVSRFPASDVDLAFWVDESVPAATVRATLEVTAGELAESVWLFDVYRGGGEAVGGTASVDSSASLDSSARRSLAFRLRLRAMDHTLTDAELADSRLRAIDAVVAAHGAELRG